MLICPAVSASASTYYIDATHGNDGYAGNSESAAWRSLHRLTMIKLGPSDQVLLKKGEIWRESIDLRESGSSDRPITIGAYGEGVNPIISANDALAGWISVSRSVWRTPINWRALQVFRNGERQVNRGSVAALESPGYAMANGQVYIFSATDPGHDGSKWEASHRLDTINIENAGFITLQDLNLQSNNSNGYGVLRFATSKPVSGFTILRTEISLGGSSCIFFKNEPGGSFANISLNQVYAHHCAVVTSSSSGLQFGPFGGEATRDVEIVSSRFAYNGVLSNTVPTAIPSLGMDLSYVQHVTLTNTEADHNGSSGINIQQGSTNVSIQGGSSHDNGMATRGDRNGIAIGGYGDGSSQIQIADVNIFGNTSSNIEIDATATENVSSGIEMLRNHVHNGKASGVQIGGGQLAITIDDNIVEDNSGSGIALYQGSSGAPQVTLERNTVRNNGKTTSSNADLYVGTPRITMVGNKIAGKIVSK